MKACKVLLAAAVILALPASASSQITDDLKGAVATIDPILNGVTTRCPAGPSISQRWSVSAVVTRGIQQNPFTPQLVPPGTPTGPTVVGYQQYALYPSPSVSGHFIWRITHPTMSVSPSDRLNGIDARYQIDLYAMSYRTWDPKSRSWSKWTTEGSFGKDVHFAHFIVERTNGVWKPQGTIYMEPIGAQLRAVDCTTLPPLE
jgi:hypothetical protein